MKKTGSALGIAAAAACAGALTFDAREARACGGCFHEPSPTQSISDITDERMLLAVSPTQTTLYDQIRYAGNPAAFAWVLPIRSQVTVALSADVMFASIDALTETHITGPVQSCPSCGGGGGSGGCSSSSSATSFDDGAGSSANGQPSVTVTKQENVGPYETVQIHSNDGSGAALNAWLAGNGFEIPADAQTTIDAYVGEGFDFLAMRLLPGQGVQAMRPVRVTSPGAGFALPLRMAAVGTGATVGITLWVVASGRYEPQNFPWFHIEDSDLVWDFAVGASDYTSRRAEKELLSANRAWEIESSIDLNTTLISSAITTGGASVGKSGLTTTSNAEDDYLPVDGAPSGDVDAGDSADGGADAGSSTTDAGTTSQTAEEVRESDIAALTEPGFGGVVRVTRMRTDLAHAAMGVDLVLQAAADPSELSNQRIVTKSTNAQPCPKCDDGGCDTGNVRPESRAGFVVTIFAALGLFFTRVLRVRRKK